LLNVEHTCHRSFSKPGEVLKGQGCFTVSQEKPDRVLRNPRPSYVLGRSMARLKHPAPKVAFESSPSIPREARVDR
jgi:hypothetical protein